MATKFQVVIVGGGPVGMGLAVELGQRGVATAVLERHREVGRLPKGQSLTNRTLEHFWFWHCDEDLRASRLLPPGYPIGGLTAWGSLAGDYWYAPESQGQARALAGRPLFFQANDRLPQYITEEVLRRRIAQLDSVTVFYEHQVTDLVQDASGVRVSAASQIWPYEEETFEAEYVVGCDGARSVVRERLGIERRGTDFDQKMCLAVFSAPGLHDALGHFPERTIYQVLDPELGGVWQVIGRVEVGKSFFFLSPVPRQTTAADTDAVGEILQRAVGSSFAIEWEHLGFWELKVEVADTYRDGRVFIAGDAAHSHPPFGGFGLNSGLEDVVNLGWKLQAALEGWGGEALLDSYSAERQPVFLATAEDVIAGGIVSEGEWLKEHDPRRDLADFEEAWAVRSKGGEGRAMATAAYEVHYDASPVVWGPEDGVTGVVGPASFAARAGHHLAPATLSSGRNVYDELGSGFTLLAFDADDEEVENLERAAASLRIPLRVLRDSAVEERAAYEALLVLVRPDQFVAFALDNGVLTDAAALLARIVGRADGTAEPISARTSPASGAV